MPVLGDDAAEAFGREGRLSEPLVLYGGRFDPFHNGHRALIECALAGLPRHRVLVVPSGSPAHKEVAAPLEARLEMARLGCSDLGDRVSVEALEPEGRPSYTIDTVARLPERDGAPVLLLGGDETEALGTWRSWRELLGEVNIAVVPRMPGSRWKPADPEVAKALEAGIADSAEGLLSGTGRAFVLPCRAPEVSSEGLRASVASGGSEWRDMVPEGVARLIESSAAYE